MSPVGHMRIRQKMRVTNKPRDFFPSEKQQPFGNAMQFFIHSAVWLCLICREFPTIVQNEIKCIKDEVQEQRNTTQLIFNAVNKLSEKLESSIGDINDRLTAISKQGKTKINIRIDTGRCHCHRQSHNHC